MAAPISPVTPTRSSHWLSYIPEIAVVICAALAAQISFAGVQSDRSPVATPTVCPVPVAVDVNRLHLGQIDEHHVLDRVRAGAAGILLANHTGPIAFGRGTGLEIDGWAVDNGAKAPPAAVYVVVNGKPIFANIGIARPDVASALNNINFEKAGFSLIVPANSLPLGRSTLTLRAAAADRSTYYLLQPSIPVDVTP